MKPTFTPEEIQTAQDARAYWKARIGLQADFGFQSFVHQLGETVVAFRAIHDKVEFSDEEQAVILNAFETIAATMREHAIRAAGFRDGIVDAIGPKRHFSQEEMDADIAAAVAEYRAAYQRSKNGN